MTSSEGNEPDAWIAILTPAEVALIRVALRHLRGRADFNGTKNAAVGLDALLAKLGGLA